jgi:hypothetical protein
MTLKWEIYPRDVQVVQLVEVKDPFALPIHPAANLFPMMSDDEIRELAEDIRKHGMREPIWLIDGQVVDGRNRLKACKLIDHKPHFATAVFGGTALDFVLSKNLHRRHLTPAQRREVIAAVLKQQPENSNRRVAAQTNTDHKTVGTVREELEQGGEIPHLAERVGRDGVKQPVDSAAAKRAGDVPPKEQRQEQRSHGPKYPKSLAVDYWLRAAVSGIQAIRLAYGPFSRLADNLNEWNPHTRENLIYGLHVVQMEVNGLLARLDPPKQKKRTDPFDDLLRGMDEMFAKYTAKEREACKTLGIPWPPTQEVLETRFRQRAKTEHPDKGGSVPAFQQLVNARDCLVDYLRRIEKAKAAD